MRILIVSGGPMTGDFGLRYYRSEKWDALIVCDAGLAYCDQYGMIPDLIMGDFDSVPEELIERYRQTMPDRIRTFSCIKDETDTELAVTEAHALIEQSGESGEIHLIGALGGRCDHLLGNLALLSLSSDRRIPLCIADEQNRIRLIDSGRFVFSRHEDYGACFSLIPWGEDIEGLTISGSFYDVTGITLDRKKSRGLSNRIVKDRVCLEWNKGAMLLIEVAEEKR